MALINGVDVDDDDDDDDVDAWRRPARQSFVLQILIVFFAVHSSPALVQFESRYYRIVGKYFKFTLIGNLFL